MTKFLLFASPNYYPYGGLRDCKGVYDTLAETEAAIAALDYGFSITDFHVLQMPEMIVHDYYNDRTRAHSKPLSEFMQAEED